MKKKIKKGLEIVSNTERKRQLENELTNIRLKTAQLTLVKTRDLQFIIKAMN